VGWQQRHPLVSDAEYGRHKSAAWEAFYRASPAQCRRWQLQALQQLSQPDQPPLAPAPAPEAEAA
jgi:phosphorylase kinase alpha/beta subunit